MSDWKPLETAPKDGTLFRLKKPFLLVVKVIGYELRSQVFPEEGMR